jgi:low affinity Fe/Cu permease
MKTLMTTQRFNLEQAAKAATAWSGSSGAFAIALGSIVVWLAIGPWFEYSNTWQLVINTGTTIVTFLMVFLIQRSQNKEMQAVQLKLNEIVAAMEGASNRLINIEDLSEKEVACLHGDYDRLQATTHLELTPTGAHSIEEAVKDAVEDALARSGIPLREKLNQV